MKIFLKKSNPKAHNHQIHQGLNEAKNAKGSQRERSVHPQKEVHQTHSESLGRNPASQKRVGPIFNIVKEKNFQPRISYQAKLSFISEGEKKSFTEKQMLRDFTHLTRTLERSTKNGKGKPVSATKM